jgi:hypothetical protein
VPSRTSERLRLYEPEWEAVARPRDTEGGWTWLRPGVGRDLLASEITVIPRGADFGYLADTVLFWDVAYHGLDVPPLFRPVRRRDLTRLAGMVRAHRDPPPDWAAMVGGLLDEFLPASATHGRADLATAIAWTVPYGEEVELAAPGRVAFPASTPHHRNPRRRVVTHHADR